MGTPARESVAPTPPHWNHGSKMATPNGSELTSPPRSRQRQDSTRQGKMLTLPHSSYSESIFSSVLIFSIAFEACYLCVCVCVCVCVCACAKSLQLCLTLCDPMDCSPPGCSVHGILQTRILEWVAMLSSRGYSWLRDKTHISVSCIGRPQWHRAARIQDGIRAVHSSKESKTWLTL